jgi:hypothetical protein
MQVTAQEEIAIKQGKRGELREQGNLTVLCLWN